MLRKISTMALTLFMLVGMSSAAQAGEPLNEATFSLTKSFAIPTAAASPPGEDPVIVLNMSWWITVGVSSTERHYASAHTKAWVELQNIDCLDVRLTMDASVQLLAEYWNPLVPPVPQTRTGSDSAAATTGCGKPHAQFYLETHPETSFANWRSNNDGSAIEIQWRDSTGHWNLYTVDSQEIHAYCAAHTNVWVDPSGNCAYVEPAHPF